jgi:hypothetical protein
MKRIKSVSFSVIIVLLGVIALSTPNTVLGQKPDKPEATPTQVPPPLNVKVINTTSEPVPVSGTVTVGNLGSSPLAVQVVNTSNEPATVTGTVNVTNQASSPLLIRNIDEQARIPFQQFVFISSANSSGTFPKVSIDIPDGKMLVVEYVSGSADSLPGFANVAPILEFISVGKDGGFEHWLECRLSPTSTNTFRRYQTSEPVRLYMTQKLDVGVKTSGVGPNAGGFSARVNVSGYLINAPQ